MSEDSNQIIEERRNKLKVLREKGVAFPNDFNREHEAGNLHKEFAGKTAEQLEQHKQHVAIAGRMVLKRVMGKASFATLQDGSGRMQMYVQRDEVGEDIYSDFKHWDLGDIVAVQGYLFLTKTGELTIHATSIRLLTKALRPLPEKFHGLNDQEQKYRQRYLDLITNEESRHVFITRSRVIQKIREFLVNRHYLEVETPMMHPIPGGAAAKPFVTHHNALDMP